MKRILTLCLALALACSLVPAASAADDESAYAAASAADIRVSPPATNTDGLLKFDETPVLIDGAQTNTSLRELLNQRCRTLTQTTHNVAGGYELEYISYISLSPTQGTLYDGYNAEGDPGAGVAGVRRYYYSSTASSNYKISDIQFVPAANFTGEARITYYGYYRYPSTDASGSVTNRQGTYSGSIYITVAKQVPGISYSTDGEAVRFSADDFVTFSLATTGRTFRYVTFTLPDKSMGTLYYNYLDSAIYDSEVKTGARYYRSDTPNVGNVYFVPNPDYSGEIRLRFELVNIAGNSPEGTCIVNIKVTSYGPQHAQTSSTGAFTYEVKPGESRYITDLSAFSTLCQNELGSDYTFARVRFMSLPSSWEGTLYLGSGTTLVRTTTDYYASGGSYLLSNVRFVPHYNYEGTVTVPFRGYGTRSGSTRYFDGELTFIVSNKGGSSPLHYTVAPGKTVYFEQNDFIAAAAADMSGYSLNHIDFDSLPRSSAGTLYYLSGNNVSQVTTNRSYSVGNLSSLHFTAAAGFTGSVTVPFTGYASYYSGSSSRRFTGTVTISSTVSEAAPASTTNPIGSSGNTLTYYSSGIAVPLRLYDIQSAAAASLPGTPVTLSLTRPETDEGRLCLDFVSLSSYDAFDAAKSYPLSDAGRVSFLPKAGFSGTSRISYTVSDAGGNSFRGNIQFVVTPPTRSSYFTDMGDAVWAIPSVDFFRYYGATNGNSGTGFGPNAQMRRGDFLLLLSRAFSFPNAGSASFADVPADKYYAAAIASAKSLGIVGGGASDSFYPEDGISRQDAALYLYRALRRAGRVTAGSAADLSAFRDAGDVAGYAAEAMGALVRLGVFQGDYGRLYPTATLSRAETMKILYYALT